MNTLLAVALGGVMLIVIASSLIKLAKDARTLDARNRRIAVFILIAVMFSFLAMLIIVHSVRIGCFQWQIWVERCR